MSLEGETIPDLARRTRIGGRDKRNRLRLLALDIAESYLGGGKRGKHARVAHKYISAFYGEHR